MDGPQKGDGAMLWTVFILLLITIVLAIVGFSTAAAAVQVLFWIFLALLVVSLIVWLATGRRAPL